MASILHIKRDSLGSQRSLCLASVAACLPMMSVASVQRCVVFIWRCVANDAGLVETGIVAIIDAMSLSEVISRNSRMTYCNRLAIILARGSPGIAFD